MFVLKCLLVPIRLLVFWFGFFFVFHLFCYLSVFFAMGVFSL